MTVEEKVNKTDEIKGEADLPNDMKDLASKLELL